MLCEKFLSLNNGQKLPVVGLGTWQAKGADLENALDAAFDAGYRYFDTGLFYENQNTIGAAVNKWIADGKVKREDIMISSTFSIMELDNIELLLNLTLQNLQLDYVDLFLIQFPVGIKFNPDTFKTLQFEIDPTSDIVAVWKKLEEFVRSGKVKGIGMSSFTIPQMQRILNEASIKPTCVEIEVHLFLQQQEIINFCKNHSIDVIAFCPLGSPGYNNFMDLLGFTRKQLPDVLNNSIVKTLANKHLKTSSQIVLRYLIQRGLAVIPKSVNSTHIKENIDIFNFSLDENDMDMLKSLDEGPSARIVDYAVFTQFKLHPEYPF